jgi:hypothetical protein
MHQDKFKNPYPVEDPGISKQKGAVIARGFEGCLKALSGSKAKQC